MNPMRPLHLNAFPRGGAARAVERLADAQRRVGAAPMILSELGSPASECLLDHLPFYLRPFMKRSFMQAVKHQQAFITRDDTLFSTSDGWHPTERFLHKFPADILHMHWISCNFIPIKSFSALQQPLVWTLHDMWGFTGGCHVSRGCKRYEEGCGSCHLLHSHDPDDLSRQVVKRKQQYWADCDLTIITPSRWLADCARNSVVLGQRRIEVIPNGVDTSVFRPINRAEARAALGLHPDRLYVAFGTADLNASHKGLKYLIEALQQIRDEFPELEVLMFGRSKREIQIPGVPVHAFGIVYDDPRLNLIYTAADVFAAPSREDNLPNTVMEALSSGTPSVAYDIGGLPDMIEHQQNGYLAQPFEVDDLANGLRTILKHPDPQHLRNAARAKVEQEFALEVVGRRTLDLYAELLQR